MTLGPVIKFRRGSVAREDPARRSRDRRLGCEEVRFPRELLYFLCFGWPKEITSKATGARPALVIFNS
jgi:hypothetical protein